MTLALTLIRNPHPHLRALALALALTLTLTSPSPNPEPDQVPTGSTVLKRRQLRAAGWSLVVVPYWEWNALGRENDDLATTTAAREDYMRRALSPYVFDALSEV